MTIDDKKISENLYMLKAIAIISAISAHSHYYEVPNGFDYYVLARFARMGVFTFFFISGYYFHKHDFKYFFQKKVIEFVSPWLVLGTFIYFFTSIYSGSVYSIVDLIYYLIGNGSTLYFCTVLIIIRTLFNIVPNSDRILLKISYSCLFITCISLFITSLGILPQNADRQMNIFEYINPYLNTANWIGIYALGIIFRKKSLIAKIESNSTVKRIIILLSFVVLLIGMKDDTYSYWSKYGIYCEFSLFFICYFITSNIQNNYFQTVLKMIGKNTFPIFLLHYPILSLLEKNTNIKGSVLIAIVCPILCAIILTFILYIVHLISDKLGILKIEHLMIGSNFRSLK